MSTLAQRQELPDVSDRLAAYLDNDFVPDAVCRKALCDVSEMTWWRWERDPRWEFPPVRYVRGRKYRRAGDVRAFRKLHFGI